MWDSIRDEWSSIWEATSDFAPKFGVALLLLWGLHLIALTVRGWLSRAEVRAGLAKLGLAGDTEGSRVGAMVAGAAYGLIVLAGVRLATAALDVAVLSELIDDVVDLLPGVVSVLVMITIAMLFGRFLANLIRPWLTDKGIGWMATAVRWAFLIFGVVAGLSFLRELSDVVDSVVFVLAAIAGGVVLALLIGTAIATGVGGIDAARSRISARFGVR